MISLGVPCAPYCGLICVLLGHMNGHWEPEFLLFAWGFKYLFSASNTNKVINVIKCSFLDLFVDNLFLTVKIDLPLQLQITHFFASGQTCEIGRWSNTYFPHCIYMCVCVCVCVYITCVYYMCILHVCTLLIYKFNIWPCGAVATTWS